MWYPIKVNAESARMVSRDNSTVRLVGCKRIEPHSIFWLCCWRASKVRRRFLTNRGSGDIFCPLLAMRVGIAHCGHIADCVATVRRRQNPVFQTAVESVRGILKICRLRDRGQRGQRRFPTVKYGKAHAENLPGDKVRIPVRALTKGYKISSGGFLPDEGFAKGAGLDGVIYLCWRVARNTRETGTGH